MENTEEKPIASIGHWEITKEQAYHQNCQRCGKLFQENETIFDILFRQQGQNDEYEEWEEELCGDCLANIRRI